MLRKGQKVQLSKKLRHYIKEDSTGTPSINAGVITHIVSGPYNIKYKGKPKEAYIVACSNIHVTRASIYPIDDQPCDAEFLKEFKEKCLTSA